MICFIEKTKEGETKVSVVRLKPDNTLLGRWVRGWWFFVKWGTLFFLFALLVKGLDSENIYWMIAGGIAAIVGPFGFSLLDDDLRDIKESEVLAAALRGEASEEDISEEHPLTAEGVEEILSDEEIEKILEEYQETKEAKDDK